MPRQKLKPHAFVSGLTLNFEWTEEELHISKKFLNNGANIYQLSKELDREILEVMILVDDLIKRGSIENDISILREVV